MSIIDNCIEFVKEKLQNAEAGHDWNHIYRVWQLSKIISEGEDVDIEIVELSALLHDIADAKFHQGDEEIGPKIAVEYLTMQGLAPKKNRPYILHHALYVLQGRTQRRKIL